jgi:hypothetical protein
MNASVGGEAKNKKARRERKIFSLLTQGEESKATDSFSPRLVRNWELGER